ncbi:MAG: helix-turn-helix domain-containing protein, partial [Nitrosopumilus sp.]|nr:helix-turn-helix domain-containing protein [Nitrosopumilus sp.]
DNKNNENKSTQLQNGQCITLYDSTLTGLILEAFGDSDKKKILTSVLSESKTVYEILKDCEIPQTSGYRKVNALINNGLLLIDGFLETQDNKKTNKYRAIFHNLEINIIKDKVTINIQINKRNIENSSIISAITRLKS